MDFQQDVVGACYGAYRNGARVVMPVLPTGAGKTVIMGHIAHEYDGFGCSIAHRGELVGQLSLALAREGLRHDIVAPDSLITTSSKATWKKLAVASMTLARIGRSPAWTRSSAASCRRVDATSRHGAWRWGHHFLRDNKWGRALNLFDNAYGLLPTATPLRADGRGLGRHADGVVDAMVEGPGMRWLIDNGYLTNYHVLMPTADDLDMADVAITASGEYNMDVARKRVKASRKIVGDVVKTYLENCRGMKGITFAVDVEHATTIAAAFNCCRRPGDDRDCRHARGRAPRDHAQVPHWRPDAVGQRRSVRRRC